MNAPRRMAGLSLVEVMVSLALGLIVVGSALTVFLSNRQTYAVTEALGRIQETSRIGIELMARDLREAGGNPCERDLPVVNVLEDADSEWWNGWNAGVVGYDGSTAMSGVAFGTAAGERVDGTQALEIKTALSNGVTVEEHQPDSAQFKVNTAAHGLASGDIVMACDFDHAAIFQITNANPANTTIVHNTGNSVSPGNADTCLALSGACPNGPVKTYTYGCFEGRSQGGNCVDPRYWPAHIAQLKAWRWYIGNNPRGGRSLYRTGLRNAAGTVSPNAIEVAENVSDLQATFLLTGATSYVAASAVTDWDDVLAVRIRLTLVSAEAVAVGREPLQRSITHVVALRNRTP